ncbi:hypothetical protein ACVIIV_004835 [Bradyrhizobium sp. USDA 4354]
MSPTTVARGAFADQLTDNDGAGRDADAGRQHLTMRRCQVLYRRDRGEAGPHGAFGLIFVGAWIAKIGQDTVAHVLRDVPFEPSDRARHRALIGPQDFGHFLRIEPSRERGRVDQVDKHHGKLAALGLGCKRTVSGGNGRDDRNGGSRH